MRLGAAEQIILPVRDCDLIGADGVFLRLFRRILIHARGERDLPGFLVKGKAAILKLCHAALFHCLAEQLDGEQHLRICRLLQRDRRDMRFPLPCAR